jgi:hypothetical protein
LKTSGPPRRNTYSCTAPRFSWPPRLRFWRSTPHRLLRRHLVSSPAPTRWDRPSCQRPGNAQVYTAPRTLPRLLPPTINPRWRALGYSARFPKYGFDPEWQAFGYNPKYSGFQPRPSVLRAPQLPVSPDTTDTGGSTTAQTAGNAQLTARIGLAAQQSDPPQFPSSGTTTDAGGASTYQRPGDAQITALPGPAAQTAAGQSRFFGRVIGLPRA